jgi:hypothetical protein
MQFPNVKGRRPNQKALPSENLTNSKSFLDRSNSPDSGASSILTTVREEPSTPSRLATMFSSQKKTVTGNSKHRPDWEHI